MKNRNLYILIAVVVVAAAALFLMNRGGATSGALEENPNTLRTYDTSDIPSLDPQVAEDVTSINAIESLFVHLTNYDLETAEIVPEAAASWDVSEDGLTYTFHLRDDIPWVKLDLATGTVNAETDADGNVRYVNAHDFVYAARRACDPATGGYYSSVVAQVLAGCGDVLFSEETPAPEAFDAIGVRAVDDYTIEYTLEFPASYFLSMTPLWTLAAVPQWAIEANGENWTEAENIVTNGRFVLADWTHGVSRAYARNPLMPDDMFGSGNVDRLETQVVPDPSTGYALWLNGEMDLAGIPDTELQAHLEQFPDETDQIADLAVFYIAYAYDKEPFDDARVRAAFSAAFDRATFVEQVRQGQGLPMRHFAPPGIFGAPPIDEVGVGYNPEYAAAQLADAGYPNCEGFPQVTLLGYSGESTLRWIEFAQANWQENLGCDPGIIQIEQQDFSDLLTSTAADTPTGDRPHMWTLGWGPDYADENNWVGDVIWCGNPDNRYKRECNATDDKIVQAREESDPDVRVQLYREIEDEFFGENGEFPFAPLFLRIAYTARHTWVDRIPSLFGGEQLYNWSLDADARDAMMAQ